MPGGSLPRGSLRLARIAYSWESKMPELSKAWFQKNRFTQEACRVFQHSFQRSCRLGRSGTFSPELLLWSMLRWDGLFGVTILSSCGVKQWRFEKSVRERLKKESVAVRDMGTTMAIAKSAKFEAIALNQQYVGTEHIMLALLGQNNESLAGLFTAYDLSYDRYKAKLIEVEQSWKNARK